MRSVSFVIPFLNEAPNLPRLVTTIAAFAARVGPQRDIQFDLILVDDGSRDGGRDIVLAHPVAGLNIRVIRLSRNFGKEVALSAGIRAATADAIVLMDSDLQHPIEVVENFLTQWLDHDYDVVYGYREKKGREGLIKRTLRKLYYNVINATAEVAIPPDVGDFRLLSRRAYEALARFVEHQRFMKGLYSWIGFRQIGVPYTDVARQAGRTKFSPLRLIALAVNGLTSFSVLPLRLAVWTGLFFAVLSGAYGIWTIIDTFVFGTVTPGYPTLITAVVFIGAAQLIFLGIMGEYLGKVLMEVKQRPLYLIESDDVVTSVPTLVSSNQTIAS